MQRRQNSEHYCYGKHPNLRRQNQFPAIEDVAKGSCRQREKKKRKCRGSLCQCYKQRPGSLRNHQPCGTDTLHEGPHIRDQVGKQQIPEHRHA